MTDDSNPQGTVEQAAPADADALLDRVLGPDTQGGESGEEAEQAPESEAVADDNGETQGEDEAQGEGDDQSSDGGRFVADNAKVRLPDGTVTTVNDLKQGSLRLADYTRKTQEVAANRRELESRQAEIAQQAQAFEQTINFAIQVAQTGLPAEPDRQLLADDPISYLQQKAERDSRIQQLQQLYAAKQQHEQAQVTERQNAIQQWLTVERQRLTDAMPELKDIAKLQAFNAELVKGIEHYGFSQQDLESVYDHRLILLAKDAMAYRKLIANKPAAMAKTDGKPTLTPGRRQNTQAQRQRDKASDWQKLRASHGKDEDALDRILDNLI